MKVAFAVLVIVGLLAGYAWAQSRDFDDNQKFTAEEAYDIGVPIPMRTDRPPACSRDIVGVQNYRPSLGAFCFCGPANTWEQLHSPGTTTGCT